MNLIAEIYQLLFISSIVFIIYILSNLFIKTYGRFKLKAETKFVLTNFEKIVLWISITIFISYLF